MNQLPCLAAAIPDLAEMAKSGVPNRSAWGNLAVILIVVLVIALGFVLWAAFLRKPPGRRERGTLQDAPVPKTEDEGSGRSRRRRRRSSHRSRTPTLAETGGLPPVRDPEPPDSP